MGKNYVCIHCHFYQPPRENPWIEEIEIQDSAAPYHDWNERIFWECYAPNAVARILDEKTHIAAIRNNYDGISFNFGPTLLSWMEKEHPSFLQEIVDADRRSRERYDGHGNALAQVYNHLIMPLASERDRRTQVRWGLADFERRFGRKAEGMWLAETAADVPTLHTLDEAGIFFTILSPYQAKRVRRFGDKEWSDASGGRLDPSRPYRLFLTPDHKRYMDIFFYDGPISQAVSFAGLLNNGENFYQRLRQAFRPERTHRQMVTVATDGESYGHHTVFGEMALAYLLQRVEEADDLELANPGYYLAHFPPEWEVEIFEPSSWSCFHGVERWRSNCGCNTGRSPRWNQQWRKPLRESLQWVKEDLDRHYENRAAAWLQDPWAARDRYIEVLLDRHPTVQEAFLRREQSHPLNEEEAAACLRALEMQRQGMLMFTSCGWFFDEISGLEPVQILRYAGRALQLHRELGGADLEGEFLKRLKVAKSNLPAMGDGARIFRKLVSPTAFPPGRVAAHRAVEALLEGAADSRHRQGLGSFELEIKEESRLEKPAITFVLGRMLVQHRPTRTPSLLTYAGVKIGHADFHLAVKERQSKSEFNKMQTELTAVFRKEGVERLFHALDAYFPGPRYSLDDLFLDQRRAVLSSLMQESLVASEELFRRYYQDQRSFLQTLKNAGLKLPADFAALNESLLAKELYADVAHWLEGRSEEPLREKYRPVRDWKIRFQELPLRKSIEELLEQRLREIEDFSALPRLAAVSTLLRQLDWIGLRLNLWMMQNLFFYILRRDRRQLWTELQHVKGKAQSEELRAAAELAAQLSFDLGKILRALAGADARP